LQVRFPRSEARLTQCEPVRSQGANADAGRVQALATYKDFLTLWNNADPDIPVLKQTKGHELAHARHKWLGNLLARIPAGRYPPTTPSPAESMTWPLGVN
jgi:hypothetical protein